MINKLGSVIWVTGLSGAGKTTISSLILKFLKKNIKKKIIHLDGDKLRELFDNNKYSIELIESEINFIKSL